MWLVASIQKHFDPWHPRIIDKTEVQLDAILEAYAADHPKELKFERKGIGKDSERVSTLAVEWTKRLIGGAREELRKKYMFKLPEPYNRTRPSVRHAPATGQQLAQPKAAAHRMPKRPIGKR